MNKCPWCQSVNPDFYIKVNTYKIVRCKSCHLAYTEILSIFNSKKFNSYNYVEEYLSNCLINTSVQKRLLKNLKYIEKFIPGGRLLDAGCGSGNLLNIIENRSKHKWQLFGIDINKFLVSKASKRSKAKILNRSLLNADFRDGYFDCIICFDTLEHDINIRENLVNLRRMLNPKGALVIQVPNYKSLMATINGANWDWWSPPDHRIHFSPDTLRIILSDVGFEIVRSITYEPALDFLSNVRGAIFKGKLLKILYYPLVPVLILSHWVFGVLGYGALALFIVRKKL